MEGTISELDVRPASEPGNMFTVYEVLGLTAMRDKCLELMREDGSTCLMLSMGCHALVRQGSGDFKVGEPVVHIKALESYELLRTGRITSVDLREGPEGEYARIRYESTVPLFSLPPAVCSICHWPFLRSELQNMADMDDGLVVLYCEKCKVVLVDIARKVVEEKPA